MNSRSSRYTRTLLSVIIIALSPIVSAADEKFDDSVIRHIAYPGWFADSAFLDLEEMRLMAAEDGKQGLMVLFTTEGCSYCDAFIRKSLGDPGIAAVLNKHFVSVGLEIFNDAEMTSPAGETLRVKAFSSSQGAEFSPTILFFDVEGEPVVRLVGYQSPERFRRVLAYVSNGHYRSQSLRDYFAHQSAEPVAPESDTAMIKDPLFTKPPYALDRSRFLAETPLLVIFEKPACQACTDFHNDVLADRDVRKGLAEFEVVRLNAIDGATPVLTPDGGRATPASWFEQTQFTRLPALIFFDEKGDAVLRTDAMVLRQRMLNALSYVRERAYEQGWSYQRYARQRGMERYQEQSRADGQ